MIKHTHGSLKLCFSYPAITLEGRRIGTITSNEWDYQVRVRNWHTPTAAAPYPTATASSIIEAMAWCAEAHLSQEQATRERSSLRIHPPKQYSFHLNRSAVGWSIQKMKEMWTWDYYRLKTAIQEQFTEAINVNLDMLSAEKVVIMHGPNYFMMDRDEAKAQGYGYEYRNNELEEGIETDVIDLISHIDTAHMEMEQYMKQLSHQLFELRMKARTITESIEEIRWAQYMGKESITPRLSKPAAAPEEDVYDQEEREQLSADAEAANAALDREAKDEIENLLAKYPEMIWNYTSEDSETFDSTDVLAWFMNDNMAPLLILWEYMEWKNDEKKDHKDDKMNVMIYDDDRVTKLIVTKLVGPHWLARSEAQRKEILKGEVSIPATELMHQLFAVLAGYRQRLKQEAGDTPDEA